MHNMELYHHDIKGMHWGIRRYQNEDGSLTSEGRKRCSISGAVQSVGRATVTASKVVAKGTAKVGRATVKTSKAAAKGSVKVAKTAGKAYNIYRKVNNRLSISNYNPENKRTERANEHLQVAAKSAKKALGTSVVTTVGSTALALTGKKKTAAILRTGGRLVVKSQKFNAKANLGMAAVNAAMGNYSLPSFRQKR